MRPRALCLSLQFWAGLVLGSGCASQNATVGAPGPEPAPPLPASSVTREPEPPVLANDRKSVPSSSAPSEAEKADDRNTPEARLAYWKALYQSPRHHPAALDQEPRPTRLSPGPYACRVSREYRLRDCRVELSDGRTFLEVAGGNLLGMRGVLWDEGSTLRFEGWLSEEQPFGCSSCQDRCYVYPGSCACDPLPEDAIRECLQQPLRVTFRALGKGRYQGLLDYAVYYNEYAGEGSARHAEGYSKKQEQFEVLLVRGPPPAAKK